MLLTISSRSFGSVAAFAFAHRFVHVSTSLPLSQLLSFPQYSTQMWPLPLTLMIVVPGCLLSEVA